jgi:hypothetical protein
MFHIPPFYVSRHPGIRSWWRRLKCRLRYGDHDFQGRPTRLYYVKCQHCDDQYRRSIPPMPPMPGEVAQECPHCHNVAYGGGEDREEFYCSDCHKTSHEGDGRVLCIPRY